MSALSGSRDEESLKKTSAGFVSILEVGSGHSSSPNALPELRFTDSSIENSKVFNIFLGILYRIDLVTTDCTHLNHTTRLIDKYDPEYARTQFRSQLRSALFVSDIDCLDGFIALALLDDIEVCYGTLKRYGMAVWTGSRDAYDDVYQGVEGQLCFEDRSENPTSCFDVDRGDRLACIARCL